MACTLVLACFCLFLSFYQRRRLKQKAALAIVTTGPSGVSVRGNHTPEVLPGESASSPMLMKEQAAKF